PPDGVGVLRVPGGPAQGAPGFALKVTILVPTLNEEAGIGPTLRAVDREAFRSRGWELDLVVVDGESRDGTRQEALDAGATVIVEPRRGYGRAYKTGFAAATGEVVVTGDADGTYPLSRAHEYVATLVADGLDFLSCDRYADLQAGAMSAKHRVGNFVLSACTRTLFRVRLHDSQSGMWVIRRSALEALDLARLPDGMAFSQALKIEFFRRLPTRAREVPASLAPRIGSPVLSSWRDGLGNLAALARKRVTGRWT
ncbi:MAG: glycosyltransferase family 2 protein, partial [Thermoplasmatota archaeon]